MITLDCRLVDLLRDFDLVHDTHKEFWAEFAEYIKRRIESEKQLGG